MLKQRVLSLFSGAELFFGRHVTGLYRRGASWEVQKKAGGSETFDAVILTMPVPQILQLEGDVTQCETSSKEMSVSVLCIQYMCIHVLYTQNRHTQLLSFITPQ